MNMETIRRRRQAARISGTVLCRAARTKEFRINPSKLSYLESGVHKATPEQIKALNAALSKLEKLRSQANKMLAQTGLTA